MVLKNEPNLAQWQNPVSAKFSFVNINYQYHLN